MPGRRVLITGVSNFWGTELAARLVADDGVARVIGIDTRAPTATLAGVELIESDLRSEELRDILAELDVDTIVHNDVNQFPAPDRRARQLHDINVIGTLNLLTAAQRIPALESIVLRSSAAIYGAEPSAPDFIPEELARQAPLRTRFQRDLGELEKLVDGFARRRPAVTCTLLRLQPVLGLRLENPITHLLRLPAVPTFMGFDPRVQFLHEDDSVEALLAAVRRPLAGAVNVAGEGTVSLHWALRRLGRTPIPIPHPLFGTVVGAAQRAGALEMTPDMARYLQYGRGVDTRRMREELGLRPRYRTADIVEALAAGLVPETARAA
jgi:UDP-glucose 4-epimerase